MLQWSSGSGTTTIDTPEAGEPGIITRESGTTPDINAYMSLSGYCGQCNFDFDDFFDIRQRVQLSQTDSNTVSRFGLHGANGYALQPAGGIYFETLGADSDWFGVCRAASSQTRTSAVIARSTSWVWLRIRRVDASTIGFSAASTYDGLTGATEQTCTSNIPTTGATPWNVISNNNTANNKKHRIGFWEMEITGLTGR